MKAINAVSHLLTSARQSAGLSQRELARRAGTAQSVVARIEGGKVSPTIETLERLLTAAGHTLQLGSIAAPPLDPVIERYRQDVDRTLLHENLRKTPDQRIRSMLELLEFNEEAQRAVRAAKRKR
jgi:transcriptional regulator with XRE-family HTH domain